MADSLRLRMDELIFSNEKENTSIFMYENINRCDGGKLFIQSRDYQAFCSAFREDYYICIKNITLHAESATKGYSLFITFDDSQQDQNFENGWELVKDILIKHRVYFFKVIKKTVRLLFPNDSKPSVCIHVFKEKRDDWISIMREINNVLSRHAIRPGITLTFNENVPDSAYLSYHNSGNPDLPNPFIKV